MTDHIRIRAAEGVHIWGGSGKKDNYIHTHARTVYTYTYHREKNGTCFKKQAYLRNRSCFRVPCFNISEKNWYSNKILKNSTQLRDFMIMSIRSFKHGAFFLVGNVQFAA